MKLSSNAFVMRIMAPCAKLMGSLSLRTKLVGMLGSFIIAGLVLCLGLLTKLNSDATIAADELVGVEFARQLSSLSGQVQKLRLETSERKLGANNEAVSQKTKVAIKNTVEKLSTLTSAHEDFDIAPDWKSLRGDVQALTENKSNTPVSTAQQTKLLHDIGRFSALINEKSGLLFDPEAGSYFLMDIAIQRIPSWQESITHLTAIGLEQSDASAPPANSALNLARLISMRDALTSRLDSANSFNAALKRSGENIPPVQASAEQATLKLLLLVQKQFLDETPAHNTPVLLSMAKTATEQVNLLQAYYIERLSKILKDRVRNFQIKAYLTIIVLLFSLLFTFYLSLGFYSHFMQAVSTLEMSAQVVSSGDLTKAITIDGDDELAKTGNALEKMNFNLSALVANVRTNATMVLDLGKELSEGINDMSVRTEQQANSLLDTATSVETLSETVKKNAKNAKSVDNLASNVRLIAESSNDTMVAAVDTMKGIHASALKVHEIVSMIDRIAFQTDILALNAAVEASHAGEQGKGFAVVASEVRSLAQRSADAARQIRRLIDDSVNRVEAGVEQINEVSMTLEDIVGGIRNLAKDINAISIASEEQSDGLVHISEAIKELDEITKSNSQMAANAKFASNELEVRAVHLTTVVSTFRLRQGTADEAHALVKKAIALFKVNGMSVLEKITDDPEVAFSDRDMYVFAFDREGQYRAYAGNRAKLAVNLFKVPGLDGHKLVAEAFALPEKGGWIDYSIENPLLHRTEWKSSFIEQISEDLVIGCGIYKSV